ncbi:MAG: hypothetical protein HQ583_08570 [Candidatus Abyssubacteria bacterium]|nr:hypothetical protein [Candidatus Abyssubacteria bacterium]
MVATIPEEMRRNGRPLDPCFTPEEALYLRLRGKKRTGALPTDIRLPAQSVNRAKHSKPEWVLYPNHQGFSVGSFQVGHIPSIMKSPGPGNVRYEFKIEHVPDDDNYSHSNLVVHKKGKKIVGDGKKINSDVKMRFRTEISKQIKILDVGFRGSG